MTKTREYITIQKPKFKQPIYITKNILITINSDKNNILIDKRKKRINILHLAQS